MSVIGTNKDAHFWKRFRKGRAIDDKLITYRSTRAKSTRNGWVNERKGSPARRIGVAKPANWKNAADALDYQPRIKCARGRVLTRSDLLFKIVKRECALCVWFNLFALHWIVYVIDSCPLALIGYFFRSSWQEWATSCGKIWTMSVSGRFLRALSARFVYFLVFLVI